jgi:hypothetical protein
MLNYQLIRSTRRQTLGLQVRFGKVVVRAPHSLSEDFINLFIEEKTSWLKLKIAEQLSKIQPCNFTQDSILLYLGEPAKVNICLAKRANVYLTKPLSKVFDIGSQEEITRVLNIEVNQNVYNRLSDSQQKPRYVQKQLNQFFKSQAQQLIHQRLGIMCNKTSLIPKRITVKQYRARWGSCNNRGEVSFNYLLMMTPLFVIDYVIVHELCHLVHMNHSSHFWLLVAQYIPDYKVAQQWLKDNQSRLYWHLN